MRDNARLILEIINASTAHPTAEQIFLSLKSENKSVSFATVYNNLGELHRKGLIRKITVEGEADRYDKTARHDHLFCVRCKKIKDVYLKDISPFLLQETGESVLSYDIKINYICADCKAAEKTETDGDGKL